MNRVIELFPFFASLPPGTRETMLSRAVTKRLAHKQVLVRDGGQCSWLPFVLEGTLRLFKTSGSGREITLYRIEPGQSCILSATCILNGGSFPAIAEAEGSTEVLLVPSRLIEEAVDRTPQWRRFLFDLYARRLEDVLTLVDEVAFRHMDARLAGYLLRAAPVDRTAPGGPAGSLERTHGQIADELGTSREVVTRILRDFEQDGLIETSRGRIGLIRPEELQRRADPWSR